MHFIESRNISKGFKIRNFAQHDTTYLCTMHTYEQLKYMQYRLSSEEGQDQKICKKGVSCCTMQYYYTTHLYCNRRGNGHFFAVSQSHQHKQQSFAIWSWFQQPNFTVDTWPLQIFLSRMFYIFQSIYNPEVCGTLLMKAYNTTT